MGSWASALRPLYKLKPTTRRLHLALNQLLKSCDPSSAALPLRPPYPLYLRRMPRLIKTIRENLFLLQQTITNTQDEVSKFAILLLEY